MDRPLLFALVAVGVRAGAGEEPWDRRPMRIPPCLRETRGKTLPRRQQDAWEAYAKRRGIE